jgi:hypothetical protein
VTNYTFDQAKQLRALRRQVDEANAPLQRNQSNPQVTKQLYEQRNNLLDQIARIERLTGPELEAEYEPKHQPRPVIPADEQEQARQRRRHAIESAVQSQSAVRTAQDNLQRLRFKMQQELTDAAAGDIVAIAARHAELIAQAEAEVAVATERRTFVPA